MKRRDLAKGMFGACGLAFGLTLACSPATAAGNDQQWPTKPVKLIVTFPPGGSADALARILGARLESKFGQPFIVENKVGAGGSIGTAYVARAEPDGYTLLVSAGGSLVVNPLLTKQAYDASRDFVPISQLVSSPFALVVNNAAFDNKVGDAKALIAQAKTQKLSFASGGSGTQMQLIGELFNLLTQAGMTHVPYKGAGPAITDLVGGHVPVAFVDLASMVPHLKNDKIKVLAISSTKRSPVAPQAPTATEAGLTGWQGTGWIGLLAPAGTPPTVVERLEKEVGDALRSQDIAERILVTGNEPAPSTSAELRRFIEQETKQWRYVIETVGVKAD